MTLADSIHIQRLRVLRDAERLGNVSEACRRHGMSRTLFYRLRAGWNSMAPMVFIRSAARRAGADRPHSRFRRSAK